MARSTRLRWIFGAACALLAMASTAARADDDIEPKYYRVWQDRAPEALTVKVLSVRTTVTTERHRAGVVTQTRVEAQAQVERVDRSATGLKPGDALRINYTISRAQPPVEGPRELPLLKGGASTPVFLLAISRGVYGPAAKGASFEPLIDAK